MRKKTSSSNNWFIKFFSKNKNILIGSGVIISITGLSIGISAPFVTNPKNWYVSNNKIEVGQKSSFFFIADGGDIHDGSFNQAGYEAVTHYVGKLDNYISPQNSNFSTLYHSYQIAISRGAKILELNGNNHTSPMKEFSHNYPKIGAILLDSALKINGKQQGNVESITFNSQQVGFLAGYAAATWATKYHKKNRKSGNPKISGVGGQCIDAVVTYLAGFEQGMQYYNKTQHGSVELYPKDKAKYFGGFSPDPNNQVSIFTSQAIKNSVDIIFPVGGPQSFTVIRELRKEHISSDSMKVIGVDQDLTNQSFPGLPKNGNWIKYVFGSATKAIDKSITDSAQAIFEGKSIKNDEGSFKGKYVFGHQFIGTFKNGWLKLTGAKINGKTQSPEELFKSLGIKKDEYNKLKDKAETAKRTSDHYHT